MRALDPTNDLEYFRVRSKKHEVMVAPDTDGDYVILVIQAPQEPPANGRERE